MFIIEAPYCSVNLKMTYNKTLEIYEGDFDSHYFRAHTKHKKMKKGWVTTTASSTFDCVNQVPISRLVCCHRIYGFSTFDEAYLAKCVLLDRLKSEFNAEIKKLQERMNRLCPDVTNELAELTSKYPEHFV